MAEPSAIRPSTSQFWMPAVVNVPMLLIVVEQSLFWRCPTNLDLMPQAAGRVISGGHWLLNLPWLNTLEGGVAA